MNRRNPAVGWNSVESYIRKVEMMMEEGAVEQISTEDRMNAYSAISKMSFIDLTEEERLYDEYKKIFVDYINSKVVPSLREKHDELFLRELVRRWPKRKIMVRLISRVFARLHTYVELADKPSLEQVGGACFRDLVYREFRSKAADAIIGLIDQEREGGVLADRALLKNAVNVFLEMDSYESDFERAMLDDTEAYYSRRASEWSVQDTCSVYMLKAEECLEKEKAWVSDCLHSCSETKLLERVRNQLLVGPLNQFLDNERSGWRALIRDDKVEDLSRMYRLFQQIPQGLQHVPDIHLEHVLSEDMVLVKQAKDAINKNVKKITAGPQLELVNTLINSQDKYISYLSGFSNNDLVHQVLRRAFVSFCNKDISGISSAEILASYCDDMLKKVWAGELKDEDIYEKLDNLFNPLACICIDDRDVFAEFYRKKLAHRLLFRKGDVDLEKTILTKLKLQFGGHFTSKMEVMVTDMTLAKDNQNASKEFLNGANLGMEFNVTVLRTRWWPINKSSGLNLPAEMAKCVETFNEHYKSVEETRRLTWIYSLGTCNINATFEHKTVELIVSTYQAAVLLLFNTTDKMSFSEIKAELNLEDENLIRLLHSLSCAKYKILNKVPNTKSVSADDYFEFNSKFTDKMRRIKMPVPPTVDERKKLVKVVDMDRGYNIDSTLVRIMKSRKVMGYQELVRECIEQLRLQFKPDVKLIKKTIEDLMEREYLERDKGDPNMFRYLA